MRIEEAITSTRNRISSLKVFHVSPYRRSNLFLYRIPRIVSELIEYACIHTRSLRSRRPKEV